MKILIISDSHGNTENVKIALNFANFDKIIFLGDGILDILKVENLDKSKLIMVKGNNDETEKVLDELVIELEGKRFFIAHGHTYNVKYGIKKLMESAINNNADIVLYGHTHIPMQCKFDNGIVCINPGSVGKGRLSQNTFAILNLDSANGIFDCKILQIK